MKNTFLTNEEAFLFAEGTYYRCYDKLGAHRVKNDGADGYSFAVWAPGAKSVHVTGAFNNWERNENYAMTPVGSSGVWHLFTSGCKSGDAYKYIIESDCGEILYKADPYAFFAEAPPATASVLIDEKPYRWHDKKWLNAREKQDWRASPMNIYEVHLGSWKRHEDGTVYSYRELAETLVPYVAEMGYTHVEMMPVMEHPFDGSWGYQQTGYYAPTSRYGTPNDLRYLIDAFHKNNIGVIFDWVPGHFCRDAHGLGRFNGHALYEKYDHPQWGTYIFDFGRGEVKSFLISNALYWIEQFHVDALRVDGVTSMLYLNFGIENESQKRYNEHGGEENLEAISFLRRLNRTVGEYYPGVLTIAEESSAWPLVTYPPESGGLGFHYKWDMGWMNDTLKYMKTDFPFRKWAHNLLTFSMMYAFNENFILPFSHDEVVHGKCSLITRMPGDYWKQFAGLRLLALYQICHPGKKLNFMGNEIAQFIEWRYYEGIEWFLAERYQAHTSHREYIRNLNALYKNEKALWQRDHGWDGFEWLEANGSESSILAFIRHGEKPEDDLIVALNFLTEAYEDFRLGVDEPGEYVEVFNSDLMQFGGSGVANTGVIQSEPKPWQGKNYSVSVRMGGIGGVILKRAAKPKKISRAKPAAAKAKQAEKDTKTPKGEISSGEKPVKRGRKPKADSSETKA